MTYSGFVGSGFVGNFQSILALETKYPAQSHAGRRATIEVNGIAAPYISMGDTWKAEVIAQPTIATGSIDVSIGGVDVKVVTLDASGSITLDKQVGTGIKVDTETPTYGWRDITSSIDVRGVGANDPTFATYGATTLRQYQFSAGTMQEVFSVFHIPHDWIPGTDLYFHTHWSNAAATPDTGNVVWKFDYSFAKGFGQEAFPAVQTVQVIAASPATRYLHNVSETTAVTIPTIEIDGLILVRCYRDAANVLDTCTDAVFLHTLDIHYQSSNMATKNKSPNFYT